MTTTATGIDDAAVQDIVERTVGHLTGAMVTAAIALGDRLGLYVALATRGPSGITSEDLAAETGTHPRLIREWLDGQAAAGLVSYDRSSDRYSLSEEAALVLAVEDSPVFLAAGAEVFRVPHLDLDGIENAFRGSGGFAWKDHHPSLFTSTGRQFEPTYRNFLTTHWIPALDGVADRLDVGGSVADIGCGTGHTAVLLAQAFPKIRITGVDYHEGSLDLARANAVAAGVDEAVSFVAADATSYQGSYDLITFFDCFHDLGDPVGAARHAREHLTEDGTVMLVEHMALDDRATNHQRPMAALEYNASTFFCVPNALSQPVERALGGQAGEAATREIFEQAGYSRFRRAAESPLHIVYEARP